MFLFVKVSRISSDCTAQKYAKIDFINLPDNVCQSVLKKKIQQ